MSVCFFVPADTSGASTSAEEPQETEKQQEDAGDSTEEKLSQFWTTVMADIKKSNADHFKSQVLPLARIKKIMKLDEEVKMISSEAPVLFAKAAEIFIHELTLRAWAHTCDNKRRTLQRNDIAMAISKSDQFDFLIDIVPRHEVKPPRPREDLPKPAPPTDQYYLQLAQQHQAALGAAPVQLLQQPAAYQLQSSAASSSPAQAPGVQQPLTIMQQMVTPTGDMQPVPIQLTQAQLNMIRLQMQNNPNQPIIIHTQPQQQTPQIIQVTSQGGQQQQQQQQVYITQVASQETES